MLSINEQKTVFSSINKELYAKSSEFLERLQSSGGELLELTRMDVQTTGFSPKNVYFIKDGNVIVEYDEKELFIFEGGDIILPYSPEEYEEVCLYYSVKSDVEISCISLDNLFTIMSKQSSLISLWFSINTLNQLQLIQMIGVLTRKEERANPGFGRFKAGMEIIKEGDAADYVYSINEGTAVAIHNGVEVGQINQDEIFGAIAVLTHQKRTASVVAKTNCTVLMVHKDEFSKMVHSHPKLFLNILSSLADKIISLNAKVSSKV